MSTGQPKTAFVFAGGGSLGAVQVGQLSALAAEGLRPDLVVGSSVGAMNAAYFAGTPTVEGVERLARIWRGLKRHDVFPLSWRSALGFMRRRDFLVDSDGLMRLVHTHLRFARLEGAMIPLAIVATNILTGEAVVLTQGPAAEAIVASCAIPAAFAPVKLDGRYLADGAITSSTPVQVAVDLGATRLIVLPAGFACARETPPRGAIANALHALNLLITRQVTSELESLNDGIDYYVAPPLCPLAGSPYDFSQTALLIERASAATQAWIAEGGLTRRRAIPPQLRPHSHGAAASG
jgi:NTE family protein